MEHLLEFFPQNHEVFFLGCTFFYFSMKMFDDKSRNFSSKNVKKYLYLYKSGSLKFHLPLLFLTKFQVDSNTLSFSSKIGLEFFPADLEFSENTPKKACSMQLKNLKVIATRNQ